VNVCIVGLGKIGLPLAVQFASKGARVTGYDIDARLVSSLNAGQNPLPGERGLAETLPGLVASGALCATTDPSGAATSANAVIIIVPVDVDSAHQPDFTLLDAAVAAIAPHIKRGALVVVETTVPVGTTRGRVAAAIAAATGMTPGAGFFVAFSPERVSSGTILRDLAAYPKIVGGIDDASTAAAAAFYESMLDAPVTRVRDAETAEFSKLAETTYRDVNIALANEFARIADALGVDAAQAFDAANSQPYSHIHRPGVGVGGHCIPVYPYFIASAGTALINASRATNDSMARYAVERLRQAMGDLRARTVIVLGLAYRANVKESRHSPAFALDEELRAAGATAFIHDPLFTRDEILAEGLQPPPAFPMPCDALVVQAWHDAYAALDLRGFAGLQAILDGRGALDPAAVAAAGVRYVAIGR